MPRVSNDELIVEELFDMVCLEGTNKNKADNLQQHEVEVPVRIIEQVLVVSILAQHGKFSLRLNLLS